jgi:hypothetical protein
MSSNWQQCREEFDVWTLKRMLDRLKLVSNESLRGIDRPGRRSTIRYRRGRLRHRNAAGR